jgi:two-component system phosphate regulon sensor histidine kinase PhoR
MFWRFFTLAMVQALAALLAWALAGPGSWPGDALALAVAGSFVWLAIDTLRARRLLQWLRVGDAQSAMTGGGMWGELLERTRKLVRSRERSANDSERRLQDFLAALQASPNGVVLLDAQGRIEWFNQMAARHFGLDAARDLLQHFGNLVRDPSFASYFSRKDFFNEVVMPGRENSSSKPVKLAVHMHPYGVGRLLLLSRDITAVEQAEAMRRDFVANVSHEIRTPLTVLCGFVETLQTLPLSADERKRYLDLMAQQAQRMQSLVKDLLTLSRLEGGAPPPVDDWTSVDALMAQCEQDARELSTLLWEQPQDLVFEINQPCELAGAATELQSAMFNLVGNAVRYTPAGKSIVVNWQVLPQGGAVFSVTDTGQGIAPEHLPRLTERFYRIDRSRSRETGGTGLGLAIVKHVAQRHGAELTIESTPGKGSKFSIAFPLARVRPAIRHHADAHMLSDV